MINKKQFSKILKISGAVLIGLIALTFWFAAYGAKCPTRQIEQCGNSSTFTPCDSDFMNSDIICGDFGLYWFLLMIVVVGSFIGVAVAWNT